MYDGSDSRPRAMLVSRNFPPLVGGMERVNQHLLEELAREWRVALCGPRGCAAFAQTSAETAETTVKPLPRFLVGTTLRAISMAVRLRPDMVVAGSGLTAPIAWLAARLVGARLVVYLHGLDIIAPSGIYQRVWLPFIRACDLVLVNSRNTSSLAQARGVRAERVRILHPGTRVPELDEAVGRNFRRKYAMAENPIMLSVGRFTRRKGLAEFVTGALPTILARRPDALLVVIGEEATDALHSHGGSERERILAAARAAKVEGSIRFLGRCDESELSAAYQAAQVHVFPVLEQVGDVEGFGMVAVEAAAHGLPTVAFAVGGVPDAIEEPGSGTLVPPAMYAQFADAVIDLLARDPGDHVVACRRFALGKDWTAFGNRLRSLVRVDARV
jgi:phosphatidylinositol alpha-1,6-mannosyltransferase